MRNDEKFLVLGPEQFSHLEKMITDTLGDEWEECLKKGVVVTGKVIFTNDIYEKER
jgi:hypothetical protein